MKLRPHHGLCMGFFVGKGYSESFVRGMTEIISEIKSTDPTVTLVCGRDVICENCPNDDSGVCGSGEKVSRYDQRLLALTGLAEEDELPASEFISRVRGEVADKGRIGEICSDCCWYEICARGQYDF